MNNAIAELKNTLCIVPQSCSTLCDPWTVGQQAPLSMGILQARILERVAILQGIFPTKGSNSDLLHCRRILYHLSHQFSPVTHLCTTPCDPMDCSTPGLPVHRQLPEFTQTCVHRVGDAIQPSQPLSSPFPPAFNLSQNQGLFHWVSFSHQVAKLLEFSFSISPSNEYSGLISFRRDCLDLLAVQGTLKSLLQHHSSKASILQDSAFFIVQLSHPYMTTGKT